MANKVTIVIDADGRAFIEGTGSAERGLDTLEKKSASTTRNMGSHLRTLKQNWIATTAAIYAAYRTLQSAWNLAEQAAQYQQSRAAFKSMVEGMGHDAEALFDKLRTLSAGLIDNKTLTEATNRAISLGIPVERLGDLMLVARAKARDMGISTTQAFNDIATGIGRSSPMILDNLGLTLKVGEANEAMARSLGKTVEELTSQQQKLAILNATLEAGREALRRHNLEVLSGKEKMEKFTAEVKDLALSIGEKLIPVVKTLLSWTKEAVDGLDSFADSIAGAGAKITNFFTGVDDRSAIERVNEELADLKKQREQMSLQNLTDGYIGGVLNGMLFSSGAEREQLDRDIAALEKTREALIRMHEVQVIAQAKMRATSLSALPQEEPGGAQGNTPLPMNQGFFDAQVEAFRKAEEERNRLMDERYERETAIEDALLNNALARAEQRERTERELQQQLTALRFGAGNQAVALLSILGQKNKAAAVAALAIQKGLAMAQVYIQSKAAAALAQATYPPPAGQTMAASILAWGKVQMALIAATGLAEAAMGGGGSSGIGGGGGVGALPIQAPGPVRTEVQERPLVVNMHFHGDVLNNHDELARKMVPSLKKAIADGAH